MKASAENSDAGRHLRRYCTHSPQSVERTRNSLGKTKDFRAEGTCAWLPAGLSEKAPALCTAVAE